MYVHCTMYKNLEVSSFVGDASKKWIFVTKELSLCHNLKFLIRLSLQPNVVDLKYFKQSIL